ncbi:hypothetical protein O6H91_01G060300 [Diphasiastrum complanatum]|uniref:Uncharacterized protein n=1 Tax=Diphasiastrum complanatum TaxID=34168 RepID=A0ACC2ER90_DIPCM|nr:hypothetical protein O6H91_01G060300 [Diphasiastrum complanatum]
MHPRQNCTLEHAAHALHELTNKRGLRKGVPKSYKSAFGIAKDGFHRLRKSVSHTNYNLVQNEPHILRCPDVIYWHKPLPPQFVLLLDDPTVTVESRIDPDGERIWHLRMGHKFRIRHLPNCKLSVSIDMPKCEATTNLTTDTMTRLFSVEIELIHRVLQMPDDPSRHLDPEFPLPLVPVAENAAARA